MLASISDRANIRVGNDTDALSEHAPEADVIVYSDLAGHTVDFREVWHHTRQVRWVHTLSAGVEKLLVPELIESNAVLTNARGVFKRSLAEFAILGVLFHYKRVRRLIENQRAHRWDDFKVEWMLDRVMAVVGYGEIGRECAHLAHALGMKIHAVRRRPELSKDDSILERAFRPEQLHEMLRGADVVVAAAPLTPDTRHMLGQPEFTVMKPSAIVINVGRGPVIDQAALVSALEQGKIAGASLDVFEQEPLPPDHPLWDMDNVLISPHCTDRTEDPDWLELSMEVFLDNFERYIKGEPLLNIVDKKAGY
jgi:phosphoglycerate dehydrogenase-like enzyme